MPTNARFCAACGRSVVSLSAATIDAPSAGAGGAAAARAVESPHTNPVASAPHLAPHAGGLSPLLSASSHGSMHGRFTPGQMLAGRYRIVGLLGRGGMGEVYRADDLTLGMPVALKFLPSALASEPSRVQRFLAEVRTTRQISHPSVCRVYDVGAIEISEPRVGLGQGSGSLVVSNVYYISMEYVDGEDLSSLLRRIGRLPQDKALEIARQICAGIAAAHDQGIVHRDLKPANIMLDGRGRARVMDFGVAGVAENLNAQGDIIAGTPAYMAPEQLSGQQVTSRSDIYALGLVLYELFTGKPTWADKATSLGELRRLHDSSQPASPSSIVGDLDPLVERVIMRCLARDPAERPATALAIAAALPGGDPLAAALAAGETPSPAMVAAAGKVGAMPKAQAIAWLAAALALMAVTLLTLSRYQVTSLIALPLSTEALRAKSTEILAAMGHSATPVDYAAGWEPSWSLGQRLMQEARSGGEREWWDRLDDEWTPAAVFFYRISGERLRPSESWLAFPSFDNPPQVLGGSARVMLDNRGHLVRYETVPFPPQIETPASPAEPSVSEQADVLVEVPASSPTHSTLPAAQDQPIRPPAASTTARTSDQSTPAPDADPFGKLFQFAGLDRSRFEPAEPEWMPTMPADTRLAWTGSTPSDPPVPLRVEAATERGRVSNFRVIYPWSSPDRYRPAEQQSPFGRAVSALGIILFVSAMFGGALLAWRAIKLRRADIRGAGVTAFAVFMVVWIGMGIAPDNTATIFSLHWLEAPIYRALFLGMLSFLFYTAIEPILRRLWPSTLISWTRAINGKFRDPLVGHDMLVGATIGLLVSLLAIGAPMILLWVGEVPETPPGTNWQALRGSRAALASALSGGGNLVTIVMLLALLLVGVRMVIRNNRGATIATCFIFSLLQSAQTGQGIGGLILSAIIAITIVLTLIRAGLLALLVALLIANSYANLPVTISPSVWYFQITLMSVGSILALVIYGFFTALAGQRLINHDPVLN